MADCFHVAGLTAHQVACFFLAVKGEVLCQKAAVNNVPHVVEHALRAYLENNLIKETQGTADQRNEKQDENKLPKQVILTALNDIIYDHTGNVRVYDGENGNESRQDQAAQKLEAVLSEKSPEPFHWCHISFFPPLKKYPWALIDHG